jgi:hypothetical protein
VHVLDDSVATGEDEGRGMLQIVHDLAPDATLAFATASAGETAFANNIRNLAADGAKVIADDVTYFDEPFFQDGPVAVAVNDVTAGGATYFSSAGNNNLIVGGNNVASWEAPAYRPMVCPAAVTSFGESNCMDFDPGAGTDNGFQFTVAAGKTLRVDMQYAQPWSGVTTDLDALLLNSTDTTVIAASDNFNVAGPSATQKPFELFSYTNSSASPVNVHLMIGRFTGTNGGDTIPNPRVKFTLFENGSQAITASEYPVSAGGDTVGPTIFGHNGAGNAMSTAAVPFSNSTTPETFSSRGPVTQYFGPVSGTTPAPAITPTVLNKPDIAATDCGQTTFFTPTTTPGLFRFCGTSAAAPHAAAVAALELSANPGLSVDQVKAGEINNASPVGAFGHNDVGAGLINAAATVAQLDPGPTPAIVGPSGRTRDSTPTFNLSSSPPATSFSCALDTSAAAPCSSTFTPSSALADGPHTLQFTATDALGKSGTSSTTFTIDTTGPRSKITKHPKKRTSKRKAKFKFKALAPDAVGFKCRVDKNRFRPCGSPKKVKVKPGKHVFQVLAGDDLGNKGKATKFKWKVTG